MREIRTLRAMWRVLETEPRQFLTGHEEGNLGYMPRKCLRATAPVPDPTNRSIGQPLMVALAVPSVETVELLMSGPERLCPTIWQ